MDLRDRAARLRQLADVRRWPDTADPGPNPEDFSWQSSNDDITGYPPVPWENQQLPRYEPHRYSLAQNASYIVTVDRAPEIWMIANRNIANTNVLVYLDTIASGIAIDLGPGGNAKLPAHGHRSICVTNVGSATAVGNIVALSGPAEFVGNISISSG